MGDVLVAVRRIVESIGDIGDVEPVGTLQIQVADAKSLITTFYALFPQPDENRGWRRPNPPDAAPWELIQ